VTMPIRVLPTSSAWKGDFLGTLARQYELLGLAPPVVLSSVAEARARPELLLFFGEERWASELPLPADLASYAGSVPQLLPVIDDVTQAVTHLPKELHEFNAFSRARHGASWTDALVDEVLTLTWQRRSKRRIFISYRRSDAEGVARQLYDRYTKLSFDVFLDDVSIQHGVNFQTELRRWLDDADAVLLLISPDIASSRWVREEIEFACTRRIGLLGIIWPEERFGPAGAPAAAAQVPVDRQLRLGAASPSGPAGAARPASLTGDRGAPQLQRLDAALLSDVDHLLFTGRSQAIASRLRDLIDIARNRLEAEFGLESLSSDGDITLVHKPDQSAWFARVVPFRPEVTDLWRWWQEQRRLATPPAGVLVIYPELESNEDRAVALREICETWGATISPRLRLYPVKA